MFPTQSLIETQGTIPVAALTALGSSENLLYVRQKVRPEDGLPQGLSHAAEEPCWFNTMDSFALLAVDDGWYRLAVQNHGANSGRK